MPITDRTIAVVGQARDRLGARLDATSLVLVDRWVRAWDVLSVEFDRAVAEIIRDANADAQPEGAGSTTTPTWPSRGRLLRYRRVQAALEATEDALDVLANVAYDRTVADATGAAAAASKDAALMMATQLPAAAGSEATLAVRFDKLDRDALARIVARTTQQMTAVNYPISRDATTAITRELIRGVALGKGPKESAARMVRGLEGKFNGGLTRALVIARTETLDAYRAAAESNDAANAETLSGWTWSAKLDNLTCPACWSMHGRKFPLTDPGPLDHQQGRCTRLPTTKTWRELGFDLDEPPSLLPDAEATFRALPQADRLAIMGPSRSALLDANRISWSSLSTRRQTTGWRDSYAPTPVRVLVRNASP